MKRILRNTFRTLRATLVTLGLLLLLGLWVLRSEWAQNQLVPTVENLISDALGAKIQIGHIDIDLPSYAVLGDLKMLDGQQQTMFALREIKVGFASFSLLKFIFAPQETQRITVSHVMLSEPEAHLYRSRKDSIWNYDILTSSSTDTSSGKPLALQLNFPIVALRGGRFSMVDSTRSDSSLLPGPQLNFNNLRFEQLNGDFTFAYNPDQSMQGKVQSFSVVEAHSKRKVEALKSDYLIQLSPAAPSHLTMCFENTQLKIGDTQLDFDGQLEDIRSDTAISGFQPAFSAFFRPSQFDFLTLNALLPDELPLAEPLQLAGYVYGDLKGIYSDSLDIGLMKHTRLHTTIALTDYISSSNLRFKLGIEGGVLSFEELQTLLPDTDIPLHGIVRMKGPISGSLSQLRAPNLQVQYLDNTRLNVDARLYDYTKGDNLLMDIKFKQSQFTFREIKELIPDMNLPTWLDRFQVCTIDGKFLGGINDFVVNADMGSNFGSLSSNLHLILPPKAKDITYDGWLSTKNLDFESLQADLPIHSRYLNFEGTLKGSGTEFGKMVADVEGKLTESDIEGYHIEKMATKELKLRGYHITGEIDVTDKQGDASVTVDIDVPDSAQRYFVVGDVKHLDMAHYGLLPDDSVFVTAILNIDVAGKELEDYTGKMRFLRAEMTRSGSKDSLSLSNVVLTSKRDDDNRHLIKLRSSVADMDLIGEFKYLKAIQVVEQLAKETQLYIKNNDSITAAYYAAKLIDHQPFLFKDTLRTKAELNHLLTFFQVPLYLRPGTELRLSFEHGSVDELDLEITADSAGYADIGMDGDSIFISLQKDGSQNYLLGQAFVRIDGLSIGENVHFKNVTFEPTADATEVDYFLRASQPEIGSEYIISAQTDFKPDGVINSKIRAAESKISIRGKVWRFASDNTIDHFYEKPPSLAKIQTDSLISRYHIRGLKLYNEGQEISVGGVISRDRKDLLNVDIRNLQIKSVLAVLDSTVDMDGVLKRATFGTWNLLSGQPSIYGSGEIADFRYQKVDSIGMRFYAGWPYIFGPDYAGMRVEVGHWGKDSVITKGWYNVRNDSLHFDADSSSLQLSWVQPFVNGILSDLNGRVAIDHFKVRGTASKPELDGIARITNTSFKVDYLNSAFKIGDGQINFDNDRINIDKIVLQDTLKGSAELSGKIWYNDPKGVILDVNIGKVRNLLLMDTRKQHNDVFYGHVILDGDSARVTGNLLAPLIEAWVNTGDGSWLDIPISSYHSANRLDFVNFIQKGDTLGKREVKEFGDLQMSLTVHARENARVRLIFDEFAGDIIEATGEGTINVVLNESGEFNMFGTYTLKKGDYHFTLESVLNKKFEVNPGGRIVWNGDPFDAQVDLDALYKVNADISSLIPNGGGGSRVPVEIVMHMKGSLMTPEITLELQLDQLSEQDVLGLASYFRGIQYDEQELNKQVVSLLMFRRFTSSGAGGGNGAASGLTSSISELISNQVNNWLSQAFNAPNLGVEVNSNELQDVQLALKASLFNDRVTVERNGTLIGGNTNSNLSLGDLSVLIKILPIADTTGNIDPNAGQMVMEIFNREDFSLTSVNNVSRGVGLFYKKDFDRLKDFFGTEKHARKEERMRLRAE